MKTRTTTLSVLAALFLCATAGCKHNAITDVTPASNTAINPVNPTSGKWVVSYFNDDGEVMTAHLDGYTFDFKSGGMLAVATGAQPVNGTWRIDNGDSRQEFIIVLPAADPMLAELGEDWEIVTNEATELKLHHGHSGHVMDVQFTRQ